MHDCKEAVRSKKHMTVLINVSYAWIHFQVESLSYFLTRAEKPVTHVIFILKYFQANKLYTCKNLLFNSQH